MAIPAHARHLTFATLPLFAVRTRMLTLNDTPRWQVCINFQTLSYASNTDQEFQFKYENNFYAIRNSCLHQGFPLAEGNLKKYMVECPLHGWVYDIRDGKCLSTVNRQTDTYGVRIREGYVEIKLPDKHPAG